jgi:putative NADH-flavin reductase
MNKIAVFGASGRTGKAFVEMALKDGYRVKALVRTPSKLDLRHSNLEVIQGDILDLAKVEETIKTTEAVIDLIAQKKDSHPDLRRTGTRNILHAMQQNNVKRLLLLSSLPYELQLGILEPNDKPGSMHKIIMFIGKNPLLNNFMMFMLKNLAGAPTVTATEYVYRFDLIKQSELDWTIVRTPRLENKPPQGKYRLGSLDPSTRMSIARADVAAFLLNELKSPQYIRKMPVVSY